MHFQQTEIGEFPSAWKIDRVDSAFDIQQGKQVSSRNRDGEHQRPVLCTKNVFWNRLELADLDEMHFSEAEQTRLELRANDLLVCEGGSIGRTALRNNEVEGCLYQNHLHRLRVKGQKAGAQFGVYWLWYAYKHALDEFLPPEYSEVVYTGSNNDSAPLKEFHLDPKKERQIRKSFGKLDQMPKILIVTEKLLTGFDAPVLYAMYLDKPMRDQPRGWTALPTS